MRISLGGLHLAMTEQLADHLKRGATAHQQRCKGVTQIGDVHVGDGNLVLDPRPESADFPHGLAGRIAWKQPRRSGNHRKAARSSSVASSAVARHAISSCDRYRSRGVSIRRRNPVAGLPSRHPHLTAKANILRTTSPTRLARTGVGFAPCSLRAWLLGFCFDGRARPSATLFSSSSTS